MKKRGSINTVGEFKSILENTIEEFQKSKDLKNGIFILENSLQRIFPADYIYILKFDDEKQLYRSSTLGIEKTICKGKDSFLAEVVDKKQPLMLNDVDESIVYSEECDNLSKTPIKELFSAPVVGKYSKEYYPAYLLWCAMKKGSDERFILKSVPYLIKFFDSMKPYLLSRYKDHLDSEFDLSKVTLEQCIESNEKMERRLARSKEYFHGIIHDIRTPMNSLIGFIGLLESNERDPFKKEYLNSAVKSAEHITMLINDALDMAKIDSGNLSIEKDSFDLYDEIESIMKIFYDTAQKKKISFAVYVDPDSPKEIISDKYRMRQVLSNLLSNALKFTKEGGWIKTEIRYDQGKRLLTVSVEDNGKGISEKALKTIFLPYNQEDNEIEREYGGTGLGLSISQQIVTLLGGKISVESQEGKGSKFYFTIPVGEIEYKKMISDQKLNGKKVFLYRWKGKDDDVVSQTIRRYCCDFGMDCLLGKKNKSLEEQLKESPSVDLLLIESKDLHEEDSSTLIHLLEKGDRVLFIEDLFDDASARYLGNSIKISYPVMSLKLYDSLVKLLDSEVKKKESYETPKKRALFPGKRALVVDDNKLNLKLMREVLKKFELDVTTCSDADCALKQIEKSDYDIMFIDENMPAMLGSDAIKIIRSKEKESGTDAMPIVSLSGDSDHRERIEEAGADMILTKPVKLDQFREVFQKFFS